MRHIIHIILFLMATNGVAQNYADKDYYLIDSLVLEELTQEDRALIDDNLKVYHKAKHDTDKINALDGICENMMDDSWGKYQHLQYLLIEKVIATHDLNSTPPRLKIMLANALNNLAIVYSSKGDIPRALECTFKALKIREGNDDKEGVAQSLNNIGAMYKDQGDIPKALEYYHKSLKIQEKLGNKRGLGVVLNNIGFIYYSQGDIPKALEYYIKALKIREEIDDKEGIALSLNNIGASYDVQGDLPKALKYHQKALKIREEIGDKRGMANSLNNIGFIYEHLNDSSDAYSKKESKKANILTALEYYHKSLSIYEGIGYKEGMASTLNNLGSLEMWLGNSTIAEQHLTRGLKLAQEIGSPQFISDNSANLSTLAEQKGSFQKAIVLLKLHIQMRDSINNETTQKATAQQQAKYEYEKQKALDDADNDKKVALEKEKQKKQFIILVIIIIASCLVLLLLIIIYRRLRITKKQKVIIEEQKEVVEIAHKETQEQKEVIEEAHKEITDSINYAERIQRSFLATEDLLTENLKDYFVFFKPKEAVSGDFYWAGKLNNGNFAVVNADSTGHGVPGAIMSILNISSIEKAVEQNLVNPSEIFNATRKTIIERLKKDGSAEGGKDGMDASIISFDFANQKFTYTAANNPIWVIRENSLLKKGVRGIDGSVVENEIAGQPFDPAQGDSQYNNEREVIVIKADKMPVGKHDNDSTSFTQGEFELQKGDVVYTITDGFQDQFGGEKGKKFMVKKLRNLLLSISHLPMEEQEQELNNIFFNWKGDEEQVDDVCIIGVRV